jgi:ActR/RegA family two-component response regulator
MVRLKMTNYNVCTIDYRLGSTTGVDLIKLILSEEYEHMAITLLTGLDNHQVDLTGYRSRRY